MFIVTVNFLVEPAHREEFAVAMYEQANNSLDLESDCHVFDVCVSTDNDCLFFLFEKYTDAAAFDAHLASEHFTTFNAEVSPWVIEKTVGTWNEGGS